MDLSIPLSFGEDEDSDAPQNDAGARYSEDEDEWDRLQADSKNRDNILDAKSKESHVVHAPYFPEVTANTNASDFPSFLDCSVIEGAHFRTPKYLLSFIRALSLSSWRNVVFKRFCAFFFFFVSSSYTFSTALNGRHQGSPSEGQIGL